MADKVTVTLNQTRRYFGGRARVNETRRARTPGQPRQSDHQGFEEGRSNPNCWALGILQVRKRPARMGRNPATGEAIKIGASKKVALRASKELKEAI